MATVTKDFRVKNGLIVEGTTGTINGSSILTAANTTSDLTEGTNLYFTDARAKTSAADLLTNATLTNIQITGDGNGLVITAENGVANSTTDDLSEGLTNLYFTDERALDAVASAISAGTHSNITITYDDFANTISFTAENGVADSTTDDLVEGTTNLYFTAARAVTAVESEIGLNINVANLQGTSGSLAIAGDVAITTGTGVFTVDGNNVATEGYADQSEADAISTANTYTDNLIGDVTVDGTAGNTVTDRIATAVANLVDSAPETLDTLNELAAALGDDPDFVTTITTTIGEKVAKAGDTMTGFLTLHADPTSNLHAATKQYVDAVSTTVANLTTDDVAEGANLYFTDARAVSALEAVVPNFTEVEINSVATQVAATASLTDTNQTAVYFFNHGSYRSAKFVVKAAYGAHTEVSEVIVTLDTSDNVAITEYAVVGTNGSLGTISAGVVGTDVQLLYTAGTANTNVTVFGTLIA